MQPWWRHRRFGLLVQASLSSVPAWAPIGESATWYRAHLGQDVSNALLHHSPLPETVEHHRRHWPNIDHYDQFVDLLHFDQFDARSWTQFAVDAGMGYFVMTAKQYDGWCWWDAPNTRRRLTDHGPRRNVLAELRAACAERDLAFGAEYSLLDWADERHPDASYVDEVVFPHIIDLVERYEIEILYGRGHWGQSGEHWRSDELFDRLRSHQPHLVHNDRFWASEPGIRSIDFLTDWFVGDRDWELVRPVGVGSGYNRAVPEDRLSSAQDVIDTLTEVIARGGHLTLSMGCDGAGQLPAAEVEAVVEAGRWVRRHRRVVDEAAPRATWGDECRRYLDLDDKLVAIHTRRTSGREMHFPHLTTRECSALKVTDADGVPLDFVQDNNGLSLMVTPDAATELADVFYVEIEPEHATPIALFPDIAPATNDLATAIGDAQPGDVVYLGEGTYQGPARIPVGVTVRGLGADRTVLVGGTEPAAALGDGARLEHCRVIGGRRIAWLPKTSVIIGGADATILACQIDGHVEIQDADATRIASCSLSGVVATRSTRLSVVRCHFTGMGWDCSIDITGGFGHLVDSNECRDSLHAVRVTDTVSTTIRHNNVVSRWWGVQLVDTEASVVLGNRFDRTMRAIEVDGGTDNQVVGNAVFDGDSGCMIRNGAHGTEVTGNHFERLRVGVMGWEAGPSVIDANSVVDLVHAEPIDGPERAEPIDDPSLDDPSLDDPSLDDASLDDGLEAGR